MTAPRLGSAVLHLSDGSVFVVSRRPTGEIDVSLRPGDPLNGATAAAVLTGTDVMALRMLLDRA